jgi:hypothetical protein
MATAASQTRVFATNDGRIVIEQSDNSIVISSAAQVQEVVTQLYRQMHVCYDYCAAWKNDDVSGQTRP